MPVIMTDRDVLPCDGRGVGGHLNRPYTYDELRKPHDLGAFHGDVALEAPAPARREASETGRPRTAVASPESPPAVDISQGSRPLGEGPGSPRFD
jgi:hypothetical protein